MDKVMRMEEECKAAVSRRHILGATAAALTAGAGLSVATAQTKAEVEAGAHNHSASNPGPINKLLAGENPASYMPPVTDRGDVMPIWYSFDLTHRRIQNGGWTRQVTARELPSSQDLAGVTMRLTAGSYRELHWHTANEWAYMLYGNARVTVFEPSGTIFIGDVSEGDLWFFPTGFPHSIQGLGPDGCQFLLVFDEGTFSEYTTFLLSGWLAHTPAGVLSKNLRLPEKTLARLPQEGLYIFPGTVPGPLEDDRKAVGGPAVASKLDYTFRMNAMKPAVETAGGSLRIVDSHAFPAAKTIAGALGIVKPGALRELHWHPNGSEWQYYLRGSARMTMFASAGQARTMNYNPNDVGYVPQVAGHYVENIGNDEMAFLALFKSDHYAEVSLNQWIRALPLQITQQHLGLDAAEIALIPTGNSGVLGP
jgi:oxalate decarboxylase